MALTVELREEDSGEHAFRVAMWAHLLALGARARPRRGRAHRTGGAAARHRQSRHSGFGDSQAHRAVAGRATADRNACGDRRGLPDPRQGSVRGAGRRDRALPPRGVVGRGLSGRHLGRRDSTAGAHRGSVRRLRLAGAQPAVAAGLAHRGGARPSRSRKRSAVRSQARRAVHPARAPHLCDARRTSTPTSRSSAQQTPLWTMRRSLVERLLRPAPGEQGNDQLRQLQLARLKTPTGQ